MASRLVCLIWGHAVDNHVFVEEGRACTRCGKAFLRDLALSPSTLVGTSEQMRVEGEPAPVRIGHTLSCFLRHHTYEPVGARDGHMEYACVRCGHPLLFPLDSDPYSAKNRFQKRVRYACGLFGHHVHRVGERNGGVEYACHCGHSFVHQPDRRSLVRHPLACVLLGHWVTFVRPRAAFSEYACVTCGHPFLFAQARRLRMVA